MTPPENRSFPEDGSGPGDVRGPQDFLRRARHQIRNSLNSIQLNTQLLLQVAAREDRMLLEQNLDAIREIDHHLELMRHLSLVSGDEPRPARRACAAGDFVRQVVEMAREVGEETSRAIEVSVSERIDTERLVALEPHRLRAVLRILMRHMPGAERGRPVLLRVEADQGDVRFVIRGADRPDEAGPARGPSPSSLDLVLARTLVAGEGAEISVEEELEGAACRIRVPARPA